MLIKIDEKYTADAIQLITDTWRELVPNIPLEYDFVEDINFRAYAREKRQHETIRYASFFAIIVSCMGLFGLASLHIKQRAKEVGIRKVFGASLQEVFMVVSRNFVILIGMAFVIAVPVSWYLSNQWLNGFAYKTSISLWIYAISGLLVFILAIVSISYQAAKASMVNPVEILKNE